MTHKNKNTGKTFEHEIADSYRQMGAWKVEENRDMAGHQIDVYVEMLTHGHMLHRIAIEAKDRKNTVGIDDVAAFSKVVDDLRRNKLIDEGVMVSAAGFSRQAWTMADRERIKLLKPGDIRAMARRVPGWVAVQDPSDILRFLSPLRT